MTEIPLSIFEAGEQLRNGTLTSVSLTRSLIARADVLDPILGTYLVRFDEIALGQAEVADSELAQGNDRGPLQGIPLGIKDIIAVAEGPTTAQSLILERAWAAKKDAPVTRRVKDAGAVITGKTTTAEFANGAPDATKPFPLPKNPWDVSHYPGGSSSGTGNGIAAGLMLGGLGTDTGGSIRGPASYCGISGLKPTFGLVPKSGCVPLADSLDHIGPMARTARDCALILTSIAGYDASDPQASPRPVDIEIPTDGVRLDGMRIGVDRLQPAGITDGVTVSAFEEALQVLEALGAQICDIELPLYKELVGIMAFTRNGEAFAYHHEDLKTRWKDYGAMTRRNLGRGALMSGGQYVQAQRVRRVAQRKLAELFGIVDVVVSPTVAAGAPPYLSFDGEITLDSAYQKLSNTQYWNPTGLPVLAIPMGFIEGRLPVSLQLAGRPFEETTLLQVGHAYQEQTTWHRELAPTYREVETAQV